MSFYVLKIEIWGLTGTNECAVSHGGGREGSWWGKANSDSTLPVYIGKHDTLDTAKVIVGFNIALWS